MLEYIAAAVIAGNIYLAARQNIWCWPLGVVGVSLYLYIFFTAKLYSDTLLQIFFLAMQFYGWYHWVRGGVDHSTSLAAITRLTTREWWWTVAGAAGGTAVLGTVMHRFTDAALPYPDAFVATVSVIAQFMMTRKVFDNWTLWIVVNLVSIAVYAIKALYPTVALYILNLVLCMLGYREWRASVSTSGKGAQPGVA
jgi:nicotinamide mononucleotide transporter